MPHAVSRVRAAAIAASFALIVTGLLCGPGNATAFEGCDVTGTWQSGSTLVVLAEDGGAISGQWELGIFTTSGRSISGARTNADVSWAWPEFPVAVTFSGTMTDCSTIDGTQSSALGSSHLVLTRVRSTYCGDGTIDEGYEECDDGNFLDGDSCTGACLNARCGNRIIEPGEICDDGNQENNDGCNNACQGRTCSNGSLDSGEECDDGNLVNGDGCSALCKANDCGNGIIEPGEECDDHNEISGDQCSSLCQFEGCDATGTWQAGATSVVLVETEGMISGEWDLGIFTASGRSISGARSGTAVSWAWPEFPVPVTFAGSMTNCSTIDGTQSSPLGNGHVTLARVRTTYCGDGTIDEGYEECDDGNFLDGDYCTRACLNARCGNQIVEPGEICDDGNPENNDGCNNACQGRTCGNGSLDSGEECDDGNLVNGDGCSALCKANDCGNGIIEPGEECDDHNEVSGDGCSSLCVFEGCDVTGTWRQQGEGSPYVQLVEAAGAISGAWPGGPSIDPTISGTRNGVAVSWFWTAFGPAIAFTGQLTNCNTISGGFSVLGGPATLYRVYCGDGRADAPETCDDSNHVDGDCCSADCQIEPADTLCRPSANDCDPPETCDGNPICPGDVIAANGASCSDGNACSVGDRCVDGACVSIAATDCNDGNACTDDACVPATGCTHDANAAGCDDGLFCTVGDTCGAAQCSVGSARDCSAVDTQCTVGLCDELTDTCAPAPVTDGTPCDDGVSCTPLAGDHCVAGVCVGTSSACGDGAVSNACSEQCDDGNVTDGDGCSAACRLENGWSCSGTPSVCAAQCGDGTLDDGELCDDAGTEEGDGCSSTCAIEDGWSCADEPSLCTELCGDGIRTAGEECEDGNLDDGDGCESTCVLTPKSVVETAPPGGTVRTDVEGDGVNAADPVETAVTSPTGGDVTITRQTTTELAPAGFLLFDQQVVLHVPPSLPPNPPLKLVFTLDAALGPGVASATVPVFRNGILVLDCTGPAGTASPNPCVASRVILANGEDLEVTVYTTNGSTWTFAQPICAATPRAGCRSSLVAGKSTLKITDDPGRDAKDKIDWSWAQGESTEPGALGDPIAHDGYALCIYVQGALLDSVGVGPGGTCGRHACWKRTKKGFVFTDGSASQQGVQGVKLLAGRKKAAKAQLRGKGANLDLPSLSSLTAGPIVTQLVNGAGSCWEARFSPPFSKNDGKRFVDTAD